MTRNDRFHLVSSGALSHSSEERLWLVQKESDSFSFANKKAGRLVANLLGIILGSPAISCRHNRFVCQQQVWKGPVAFRLPITRGLALSMNEIKKTFGIEYNTPKVSGGSLL